jgi:hypothetical protein
MPDIVWSIMWIALAAIAYFGGIIAVSIGIIAAGVRLGTRKRRD